MKIAINGFGRIGLTFLRTLVHDPVVSKKIKVADQQYPAALPQ